MTWQSVIFAVRKFLSALRSPIHTEEATEHGSPTSDALRLLSTELPREYTHVPAAFVPARLPELSDLLTSYPIGIIPTVQFISDGGTVGVLL